MTYHFLFLTVYYSVVKMKLRVCGSFLRSVGVSASLLFFFRVFLLDEAGPLSSASYCYF